MISLLPTEVNPRITQFFANTARRLRVLAGENNAQRTLLNDLGLVQTNGRTLRTLFDPPIIEEKLVANLLHTLFEAIANRDHKEITRISKQYPSIIELAKKEIQRGKQKGLGTIKEIFAEAFNYGQDIKVGMKFLKDTLRIKEFGGLYGPSKPNETYAKALELALKINYSNDPLEFILENSPTTLESNEFIDLLETLLAKILTRDSELDLTFSNDCQEFSTTDYNLKKIEMLCKKIQELRVIELGEDDPDTKLSMAATDWLRIKQFGPVAKWDKWDLQNRYVSKDGISAYFSEKCETKNKLVSILRQYAPDNLKLSYEKLFAAKA